MNENQFSLRQLLATTGVIAVGCAIVVKLAENEILRGPLIFMIDPAPPNKAFGLVAVPVLAGGMLSVFVKPNLATALVCAVSALLWLALGFIGMGIQV